MSKKHARKISSFKKNEMNLLRKEQQDLYDKTKISCKFFINSFQ